MIQMIKDYCDEMDGDIKEYEPMIEIFEKVDRLVDIINATRVKNGKDLKVEFIDHPRHRYIYELFSILQLFEEWKKDAGGLNKKFITRQIYEDLCWMVFGMAGLACTYLEEDKSKQIHQGRSGSDVCEHFFAKIRQVNSNPTRQQAREITSKISGQGNIDVGVFMGKAGHNTAGVKREAEDFFAPLAKKPKKSNN
ncbi:hypothetical protein ACHAXR_008930 [Thalassiosira sp. AJA248-18]